MPTGQPFGRTDTFVLRSHIEKKIGRVKMGNYIDLLSRYLRSNLSKSEFDKLCIATVGRENIFLHNALLRGIIKNVCLSKTPPSRRNILDASLRDKKESNGFQTSISIHSLCKDLPRSPRKGRSHNIRDRRFKCSKGKSHVTIEDGEEVDQSTVSPGINSKNLPIEAPLGVNVRGKTPIQNMMSRRLLSSCRMETCYSSGELLDTISLKKKMEETLEMEGLQITDGVTNLLNMGLDVFLKSLIKPCLELAGSRSYQDKMRRGLCSGSSNGVWTERYDKGTRASVSVSMVDFQVATELHRSIIPMQLDKVGLLAQEE